MPETYGELVTRLCQMRDEMNRTPEGAGALIRVVWGLEESGRIIDELGRQLRHVQAERDAAVRDMKEYGVGYGFTCEMCKACGECPCGSCDGESNWQWRGLPEKNTRGGNKLKTTASPTYRISRREKEMIRLEYAGENLTLEEWSRVTGKSYNVLYSRLKNGWDVERTLMKPERGYHESGPREPYERRVDALYGGFDTGFERLAAAIAIRAVLDYKDKRYRTGVEVFFRSKWFSTLFDLDGEYILRKLAAMEKAETRPS